MDLLWCNKQCVWVRSIVGSRDVRKKSLLFALRSYVSRVGPKAAVKTVLKLY